MTTPVPPEPGRPGPGDPGPPPPGSPGPAQRTVRRSRGDRVIAGVSIPEEGADQPAGPAPEPRRETGRMVLGGSLVVLGLVLLLDRLAPDLDELFWPVAVVAVG